MMINQTIIYSLRDKLPNGSVNITNYANDFVETANSSGFINLEILPVLIKTISLEQNLYLFTLQINYYNPSVQ